MAAKFSNGTYKLKNPEKYIGNHTPKWRSSWEWTMMKFCDEHPSVLNWASEAIKIPYKNPFTGKFTVYVPDFFIVYADKNNKQHAELIEVKPANQAIKEKVGRSKKNQAHYVLNQAKWKAAHAYCKQHNITFRVITENDIYRT